MEVMEFKSKHNIEFLVAPGYGNDTNLFKIGTCDGLYSFGDNQYTIIGITNDKPGNGHFDDVLEWFENSCQRDGYDLVIAEIMNQSFMTHLIAKRGFEFYKNNYVIKTFKKHGH